MVVCSGDMVKCPYRHSRGLVGVLQVWFDSCRACCNLWDQMDLKSTLQFRCRWAVAHTGVMNTREWKDASKVLSDAPYVALGGQGGSMRCRMWQSMRHCKWEKALSPGLSLCLPVYGNDEAWQKDTSNLMF